MTHVTSDSTDWQYLPDLPEDDRKVVFKDALGRMHCGRFVDGKFHGIDGHSHSSAGDPVVAWVYLDATGAMAEKPH